MILFFEPCSWPYFTRFSSSPSQSLEAIPFPQLSCWGQIWFIFLFFLRHLAHAIFVYFSSSSSKLTRSEIVNSEIHNLDSLSAFFSGFLLFLHPNCILFPSSYTPAHTLSTTFILIHYSWYPSCTVNQNISLFESLPDETIHLLEVRRHFVSGNVEGVDDFMVDGMLFWVSDTEHCGSGED